MAKAGGIDEAAELVAQIEDSYARVERALAAVRAEAQHG
jgi:hypothetical protein